MKRWLVIGFALAIALVMGSVEAQNSFPTLMVPESLFSDGERSTLQRDADLAQRSGVPIMFVVVSGDGTSAGSAQHFADQIREEYEVETAPGADNGIVFLIHWVQGAPETSPIVYSAGEHAFDTTGLGAESIDAYIAEHVQPWVERGQVFEASAYLIRFTRYTSLYVPPPVAKTTGAAKATQRALALIAPVLAISAIFAMWRERVPGDTYRYRLIAATLAGVLLVAIVSVWTHSGIGVTSILVALGSLTIWCLWVTRDRNPQPDCWKRLLPDIALTALMVAVSFTINLQQVETTPTDRDETRWMSRAHFAADLGDPFGPTWQDYPVTIGQPPLGSIAIGIGLALQGEPLRDVGVWDYQYGRDWYRSTGGHPSDEMLRAARKTNVVIGALTTGAAFVLGRLLTNRVGGMAAAIYVAWHPLHIVLSTQALSDQTFALLLLLALIAAWQFAAKPTWARAIALGVLLGLGGATKLTPLLLAPPLVAYGLMRLSIDRSEDGKRASWMLIAQPVIAFAAFVAIYPWTWVNPIERTWRLFAFRSSEMDAQTAAWPNALTEGPLHALARFGHKLTYTHSTSQKAIQAFYDWAGVERVAVGIDLVVAAAGAVILLWLIARGGLWTPEALVGCLLLGELAMLAIGMKADFYRYHLPVVMIVSACVAMAVGTGWNFALNLLRRRSPVLQKAVSREVATQ